MKLTPQQVACFKGLEVAVGGAIVSAVIEDVKAGGLPHDRAGWIKFAGVAASAAYGAARLYLAQSPLTATTSAQGAQTTA